MSPWVLSRICLVCSWIRYRGIVFVALCIFSSDCWWLVGVACLFQEQLFGMMLNFVAIMLLFFIIFCDGLLLFIWSSILISDLRFIMHCSMLMTHCCFLLCFSSFFVPNKSFQVPRFQLTSLLPHTWDVWCQWCFCIVALLWRQ